MNKVFLKFSSLLLICAIISSLLASCGIDQPEPESDSDDLTPESVTYEDPQEETEDPASPELPEITWDGAFFNVLGHSNAKKPELQNFEIVCYEETVGEGLDAAIYRRNTKLEELYDVKISQSLVDDVDLVLSDIKKTGDRKYDLVFHLVGKVGNAAIKGHLLDMNTVEYIDFTKPYWENQINDSLAVADRVYFAGSDFSLRDKSRAYVLSYNKNLAAENGIPDIAEAVWSGKWTLDLMTEYADIVDSDLNKDGERKISDDRFGLVADDIKMFSGLVYGMGNTIIGRDGENKMTLVVEGDKMKGSIDRAIALFCNDTYSCYDEDGRTDAAACWTEERALFAESFLGSVVSYYESCDFDFALLPMPKFDESQNGYYTVTDESAMLFGIPYVCKDPDFSGFMAEALSAEATDTSFKAYRNEIYNFNIPENEDVLDLIIDGIRYDAALVYSIYGIYDIMSGVIPEKGYNAFDGFFERLGDRIISSLEEIETTLGALDH